ncbi:MAG: hypothetical protein ACJAR2_001024, partial [Ilumatobacter sp.]
LVGLRDINAQPTPRSEAPHYFGDQRNIAQQDVPLGRIEAEVAAPTDVLRDRRHRPVVGGAPSSWTVWVVPAVSRAVEPLTVNDPSTGSPCSRRAGEAHETLRVSVGLVESKLKVPLSGGAVFHRRVRKRCSRSPRAPPVGQTPRFDLATGPCGVNVVSSGCCQWILSRRGRNGMAAVARRAVGRVAGLVSPSRRPPRCRTGAETYP